MCTVDVVICTVHVGGFDKSAHVVYVNTCYEAMRFSNLTVFSRTQSASYGPKNKSRVF